MTLPSEIQEVLDGRRKWALVHADNRDVLPLLPDSSIDSVVTDPPYELGFMSKKWDGTGIAYSVDLWREVLRVLKPGGHLLAFGGTRTYHRMACAIEDAGFEIRDSLHWMYGTGFPKSLTSNTGMPEGQGTALKPGHEPIVLARKPLAGTVAENVSQWGTGGLNIDGCRIEGAPRDPGFVNPTERADGWGMQRTGLVGREQPQGRWPANVLLDEDAAAELDGQSGVRTSGKIEPHHKRTTATTGDVFGKYNEPSTVSYGDSGGASRFFYVAKPSRKERDQGCEALPPKSGGEATDREDGSIGTQNPRAGAGRTGGARNYHPTVKPVELMRYLVRLVTPPGGVVMDPFTGSGTTGMAALLERLRLVGCELDSTYVEIARRRIAHAEAGRAALDMAEGWP